MSIRQAAVAGQFYPADKSRLIQDIEQLLANSGQAVDDIPKALIVPHAGYVYSGSTAAAAYRTLRAFKAEIKKVVMLGPAHRVYLRGMALPSAEKFNTPLGNIKLDSEIIDSLTTLPGVAISDEAHRLEHSLEVQLPFLQTLFDDFTLVPVVVGESTPQQVATLIDTLAGIPQSLIVISSDLSHFHDYRTAQQIDASTSERILQKSSQLTGEEACGARAINGLMASSFAQSLNIELLAACNSGDTAGDKNRVVGYASFLLH